MTPSAHAVRGALASTMEAQAAGRAEALQILNPDPEVNSLAEYVVALKSQIDQTTYRAILRLLRDILALNIEQLGHEYDATGVLDELATILHRAECERQVTRAIGVKAIARNLRGPLGIISRPLGHTAAEFIAATRTVDEALDGTSETVLRGPTLRHELGRGPHNALLQILDAPTELAA